MFDELGRCISTGKVASLVAFDWSSFEHSRLPSSVMVVGGSNAAEHQTSLVLQAASRFTKGQFGS